MAWNSTQNFTGVGLFLIDLDIDLYALTLNVLFNPNQFGNIKLELTSGT